MYTLCCYASRPEVAMAQGTASVEMEAFRQSCLFDLWYIILNSSGLISPLLKLQVPVVRCLSLVECIRVLMGACRRERSSCRQLTLERVVILSFVDCFENLNFKGAETRSLLEFSARNPCEYAELYGLGRNRRDRARAPLNMYCLRLRDRALARWMGNRSRTAQLREHKIYKERPLDYD